MSPRPLVVLFAVASLLFGVAGCGSDARRHAREQIRQSGHALTNPDFVKAAGAGDLPLVQAYLQAGMDRNGQDAAGVTPLMAAAAAGKLDAAKALLDENAKPDLAQQGRRHRAHPRRRRRPAGHRAPARRVQRRRARARQG